jgi:hypothetical protein
MPTVLHLVSHHTPAAAGVDEAKGQLGGVAVISPITPFFLYVHFFV